MDFGEALAALKQGRAVERPGWNGEGMHVYLHGGTGGIKPFLAVKAADGNTYPWVTSQTDVLAEDWAVSTRPAPAG